MTLFILLSSYTSPLAIPVIAIIIHQRNSLERDWTHYKEFSALYGSLGASGFSAGTWGISDPHARISNP